MLKRLNILAIILCLSLLVFPTKINAISATTLKGNKIQTFIDKEDWKYPEITSNMIRDWPRDTSAPNAASYKGATNVPFVMYSPGQPNIKLKYAELMNVNNIKYDLIFTYYKIDWTSADSTDAKHVIDIFAPGVIDFDENHDYNSSDPAMRDFSTHKVGGGAGWIPGVDYNPTPWDYDAYPHAATCAPWVYVEIEIKNSETGEYANIPELAFYVTDLDKKSDGFQYTGSQLTKLYQNEKGFEVDKTEKKNTDGTYTYTFYGKKDATYNSTDPRINLGTVILQSDDISSGHFYVNSAKKSINNKRGHIEFGGIMFVGTGASVKYISDNTDDDLSEYDADFLGTTGQPIDYSSKAATIAELESKGFVVVRDDFGEGKNFTDNHQTYEIHVKKAEQQAKTVFLDVDADSTIIAERPVIFGFSGDEIVDEGYLTDDELSLKYFADRGYELALNGDEYVSLKPKFDDIIDNVQEIQVRLKHTYTTVNKDTYEPDKCLNNACSAKHPEKGC